MRFDLVDLRLFDAIVQSGSISKGAEAAHMALASASARVSGMEAALGMPLLDRGRRGVTPTAAGRTLLHHARAITAQVERMRGDLRSFSDGLRGEIRMLSNTAALVDLLPAALGVFLAAHPGVDIDIEERTSAEIVLAVADGQVEFGVIAASADPGPLEVRPLGIDRLTVIVSRSNPLAGRPEIGFSELLDEPFVGLSAGALHDHLALNAARIGRRINYRVRLRSFEAIAKLVEAGIGVGILPLAAVERHINPGLTVIRLTDGWADRRLVICARSFVALTAHARSFVDEIARQGAA
ncbi:LysR family transcriptional regulator [Roseiarcaceae bacterium H3SJ34-1]|uniref:LysR family transcriptional regulator n=1 Tax=Terripilifer ovatus TaxID=3032367 RepID=UPI003AB9325F|nr:LysR family transcriptional regulator [Roseiarcaceae bacterium H3SJ34-1]